jgi:DNA segregation ATPase FtsK/SpoIIIE, S-DNA-T family
MNRHLQFAISVVLAIGGFALLVALVSYKASQIGTATPAESHPFGMLGAWISHALIRGYGLAAALVPMVAIGWAVGLWRDRDLSNPSRRIAGAIVLLPSLAGLLHLLPRGTGDWVLTRWDQSNLEGLGGAIGYLLCGPVGGWATPGGGGGFLRVWLDTAGAAVLLAGVAIFALWLMDLGIIAWVRRLWYVMTTRPQSGEAGTGSAVYQSGVYHGPGGSAANTARATTSFRELRKRMTDGGELPGPNDADEILAAIRKQREALEEPDAIPVPAAPAAALPTDPIAQDPIAAVSPVDAMPVPSDDPVSTEPVPAAPKPRPKPAQPVNTNYALPSPDLLQSPKERSHAQHEQEKQQTSKAIEAAFGAFNVDVSVVGAVRGPTVTQYELKLLDESMRVNKVEGFEQDLSLKLGTEGIRIVAPLPNRTTIGVEVPNKTKDPVVMRDLVDEIDPNVMALPVVLGRDVVGKPLIMDLAKAPHLLVAGSTGMGKSVCMNAMICSILLFRRPDEVKFIMVDPKMVELSGYEDIPHLLTPPITDMTKAHAALDWACQTMDERYDALRLSGCRSIADYNALGEEELRFRLAKREVKLEDLSVGAHMPYIVVLVDEYADLMMVNKEVEKSIVRLAAKSRACGIHVILTTQRPSADVVTGLIKSNLPSRVCFRVVDRNNSRVVLDSSGAENLLGKGDMLFLQPGTSLPVRGQGVFLKDAEINAIVEHARSQGTPSYDDSIARAGAVAMQGGGKESGEANSDAWKSDRKLHEAVQAMYRYDKTGADFFRRKMGVGYNKATEYVETLEDLGFLSAAAGTASRKILKTWDEWIDLLKENGVEIHDADEIYRPPFNT